MAARYNREHLDLSRQKIKVSQLVNLLQDNALKGKQLDPIRQRSAEILLRKSLPDLSQTEIMGTVATYVARLPTPAPTAAAWLESIDTPDPVIPVLAHDPQALDTQGMSGHKQGHDVEKPEGE
jgi:hypothetical protein